MYYEACERLLVAMRKLRLSTIYQLIPWVMYYAGRLLRLRALQDISRLSTELDYNNYAPDFDSKSLDGVPS